MGGSCFLTTINPDDFWIKKINFFKDVSMTKYLGEVCIAAKRVFPAIVHCDCQEVCTEQRFIALQRGKCNCVGAILSRSNI